MPWFDYGRLTVREQQTLIEVLRERADAARST